eukprot:CAMPEP_0114333316 /NCGR_PEP_ID=MMETSP0101-20121206/3685_1 /TAXON_ID=38822 ORGANISM="Pteridomonas danica, Strain PT" /NCGR_SAMPLE_ID=MMETSP0101 /ASSEMBLY_ACC=CAM_ASM_000211 /LENGTH=161 /DNA_ID=CAMNT_0001464317 /DNA_START=877 /DNA_END=1362 /DNA_ORIENTATION=+
MTATKVNEKNEKNETNEKNDEQIAIDHQEVHYSQDDYHAMVTLLRETLITTSTVGSKQQVEVQVEVTPQREKRNQEINIHEEKRIQNIARAFLNDGVFVNTLYTAAKHGFLIECLTSSSLNDSSGGNDINGIDDSGLKLSFGEIIKLNSSALNRQVLGRAI